MNMKLNRKIEARDEIARAVKFVGAKIFALATKAQLLSRPTEKKLILLESFLGTRLECNPRAIYEYLCEHYPNRFSYIWAAQDPDKWADLASRPNTRVIRYRSQEHRRMACLASVLITNSPRSNDLPARKEQLQIQTWHGGGCYKKVGIATNAGLPFSRFMTRNQFSHYNYFVSSSKFFTDEVIRKQYAYSGEVIERGMPRNDRLVTNSSSERLRIRKSLGLDEMDYLVLFVPTWRDFSDDIPQVDISIVHDAFEVISDKNIIFGQRGHYFSEFSGKGFDRDLSDYRDMQGLLLACDAIISDYSSVIWDFSFTYRPCFLFTPDLAQYERDRGFDVDIHEWGFPVCESNEELAEAIRSFDAISYRVRMEKHHNDLGSFETGHACEAVAKVIEEHVRTLEQGEKQ
ncbi:CDP-glycerol glycerophosphotransferase family protein [Thermophilibacter immobilis]|uniref:CDP-glycerol glycerophosphotransferase family protein n=1 Tax=Thermophilibacter immobilis TaxID=2779519 RepID=A0A7S7M7T2_9ACTN|nr:CDP-glycerol glycerophosphotransferase family protein [Thermophilibacter immobilis]QOY60351.1 CDP-glycerol glycerophosphotransferase family protein [Thermophilibacter immobilis]